MDSNVTKNKTIVGFYYEETETISFKCKACPPARKSRKQAPGTGYTKLMNNIFQEHSNYLKKMREAANTHHLTPVFRATKKAQHIYSPGWSGLLWKTGNSSFRKKNLFAKTPNWSMLHTTKFGSIEIYSQKK